MIAVLGASGFESTGLRRYTFPKRCASPIRLCRRVAARAFALALAHGTTNAVARYATIGRRAAWMPFSPRPRRGGCEQLAGKTCMGPQRPPRPVRTRRSAPMMKARP